MWLGQEEKHDGQVLSPERRSKVRLKTQRQEKKKKNFFFF